MSDRSGRIEELKAQRAIQRDQEALDAEFDGVGFRPLDADGHARASERFDAFLVASDPLVAHSLDDDVLRLSAFDIDAANTFAVRFDTLQSGVWFVAGDAPQLLGYLQGSEVRGLALYDLDADVLYAVHEAEYEWEYFRVG